MAQARATFLNTLSRCIREGKTDTVRTMLYNHPAFINQRCKPTTHYGVFDTISFMVGLLKEPDFTDNLNAIEEILSFLLAYGNDGDTRKKFQNFFGLIAAQWSYHGDFTPEIVIWLVLLSVKCIPKVYISEEWLVEIYDHAKKIVDEIKHPGNSESYASLQYLRAIILETLKDFMAAKPLYVNAAIAGQLDACIRLSNEAHSRGACKDALKWYQIPLEVKAEKVNVEHALFLAHEFADDDNDINETYFKEYIAVLFSKITNISLSIEGQLFLAHLTSKLSCSVDGLQDELRPLCAIQYAASAYYQANNVGTKEQIHSTLEDISHFMNLIQYAGTSVEKEYLAEEKIPQQPNINYYSKLALDLAKLNLQDVLQVPRALMWFQLRNILKGKTVEDPQGLNALKVAIFAAETEQMSVQTHSIFSGGLDQDNNDLEQESKKAFDTTAVSSSTGSNNVEEGRISILPKMNFLSRGS